MTAASKFFSRYDLLEIFTNNPYKGVFWIVMIDYSNGTLIPIEGHWNQLDLLILFAIGCVCVWLVDTLGGLFIGMYMKKLHKNDAVH